METLTHRRFSLAACLALFGVALAVRLAALGLHPGAPIDMDGAEYARLAENLRSGHGYIGLRGVPNSAFPPLYPLAIAAASFVVPSYERAGTLVSILAGSAIVFPLYGIAVLLYESSVGVIAGLLAATVPFLVVLSTQVLSEPLFLLLSVTGIWLTLRAVRGGGMAEAVGAGLVFGGAFLTRPEGMLFALSGVAVLAVTRRRWLMAAALAAGFAVCAAPYVGFERTLGGRTALEGKVLINYAIGRRLAEGMSYERAADEVRDDLTVLGPEIGAVSEAALPKPSTAELVRFGLAATREHLGTMLRDLIGRSCGWIPLAALALWGLARGPWTRERAESEGTLLVFAAANVAALSSVWQFWPRYDAFFVPFLLLWGARGIGGLMHMPRLGRRYATVAIVTVLLIFASSYVTEAHQPSLRAEREAALRLRSMERPMGRTPIVMEITDTVSYYTGAVWRPLPYASSATALRYIESVRPNYVVLSAAERAARPYLAGWLTHGVPSPRFVRVADLYPGSGDEVAVYRYQGAP